MRILIVSDSHGNLDGLKRVVRKEQPDHIIHLGDYTRDAAALARVFPSVPIEVVGGNCDAFDRRNPAPLEQVMTVEGYRILLCHGHTFQVKTDLSALISHARQQNVHACLFGHTHIPHMSEPEPGLLLVNPGSVGASVRREYAILEISAAGIRCALKTM